MGKDPSKLQKTKPPKNEGNKILGALFGGTSDVKHPDRKSVPSTKHGHSKSEVIIEVKEVVPRNADDDTTKMPETPLGVSQTASPKSSEGICTPLAHVLNVLTSLAGSPMKDVTVTLPMMETPPETKLDKKIEHEKASSSTENGQSRTEGRIDESTRS